MTLLHRASLHADRVRRLILATGLCIILLIGLPTAQHSLRAQGKLDGTYLVSGVDFDGKEFKGEFTLTADTDVYQFSSQGTPGIALLKNNVLAISYGTACGVALYNIAPDGSLNGKWATTGTHYAGTERAIPDGGTNARTNYQVSGTLADGNPYRGILRISQNGALFDLTWIAPATVNGVGLVMNGYLGAVYGTQCGLMLFQVQSDGTLSGQWTTNEQNKVGSVQAVLKSSTDSSANSSGASNGITDEGNASESSSSSQTLAIDSEAEVTEAGNELYLLESPAIGTKRLTVLLTGDPLLLLDGPLERDGYTWWKVKAVDGRIGYVMQSYKDIQWIASSANDPKVDPEGIESALYMGARATLGNRSKFAVVVRDQPSRGAKALKRIENETQVVVVIGGPVVADGRRWWQVRLGADSGEDADDKRTGWIAEEADAVLKTLQTPDAVLTVKGGSIAVDANVRVTGSGGELPMHQDPDVTTTPIATLEQGFDATVISGPVQAQGFTWWEVKRTKDGIRGWVAVAPGWLENYNG